MAIKRVAHWLNIPWHNMVSFEILLTKGKFDDKYKTEELSSLQKDKKFTKYLMIGGAAIGAGALIGVTGGLAAPLIAAGLGTVSHYQFTIVMVAC